MRRRLEWANTLRGFAALTVVAFHFGVVFWTLQDTAAGLARRPALYAGGTGAPRLATWLAAVPVDLGGFGVALFFLLSGYVIAISVGAYSPRGFLVGRSLRVLPTYTAGYLVACAVIAVLGDPQHELHVGPVLAGVVPGLPFLLGVRSPALGIEWTLIIELIFYGVCLVAYRVLTRRWVAIAAVAALCVLVQLVVPPPAVLAGSSLGGLRYLVLLAAPFLPVMLVGVTLSGCRRGLISPVATGLLVPALAAVHSWLLASSPVLAVAPKYRLTFLVAIGLFGVIWIFGDRWRGQAAVDFVADISYPLYVVHPVLGYATLSVLAAHHVPALWAVLAALCLAFAAAWLLHRVVEVPSHRLGKRWSRRATLGSARTSPRAAGRVPAAVPPAETAAEPLAEAS